MRGRGEEEEEEEEEEEGRSSSKAQAKVWMLAFVMKLVIFIWFVWNSILIVWLGDFSKPRVVRITS